MLGIRAYTQKVAVGIYLINCQLDTAALAMEIHARSSNPQTIRLVKETGEII